jgi:hypothetical protein
VINPWILISYCNCYRENCIKRWFDINFIALPITITKSKYNSIIRYNLIRDNFAVLPKNCSKSWSWSHRAGYAPNTHLNLSIARAGPGQKTRSFCWENSAHDRPLGRAGPQFSGRAQAGLGLGRAARIFCSVKWIKTTFQARLGSKFFLQASRSLPTPVQ